MAEVFDIRKKSIEDGEKYFFDANVWIYIFCPNTKQKQIKQKIYSTFLRNGVPPVFRTHS